MHQLYWRRTFFSGGVDSFYTVLKNQEASIPSADRISHLLFIHGFDIPLDDLDLYKMCYRNIKSAAERLDKTLIPCSTNIKEVICPGYVDLYADWSMCHGQLLASVALGIERLFGRLYISSSHKYSDLGPWGSHALIDPLYGTDTLNVIHDGCEASRVQKVMWQIAKSDIALDHLRVCWRNRFGKYNCGICEKCNRTMVNLKIAGVLDKCGTFDRDLSYSDIANTPVSDWSDRSFVVENLEAAIAAKNDEKLIRALKKSLRPWAIFYPRRVIRSIVLNVIKPIDEVLLGGALRRWYISHKHPNNTG